MKKCSRCGELKPKTDFSPNRNTKSGLASACRVCHSLVARLYYHANKDECKERNKRWVRLNYSLRQDYQKEYRNSERGKKLKEKWYEEHPDYNARYYRENYMQISKQMKVYRQKPTVKERLNAYNSARLQTNRNARISHALRTRLNRAFHGRRKEGSSLIDLLGCNIPFLVSYLGGKLQKDMNWDNYGGRSGWQIDHIKPLSSFDLTDINQLKKACHYTNLQPLWAFDNNSKGSKAIHGIEIKET